MKSAVDLSGYYTYKMFVSQNDESGEDRNPLKGQADRFFVLPSDHIECDAEGSKVCISVLPNDKPDTMICEGQKIKFDAVDCSKVIVCGFGMYGSFRDQFELIYDDGSIQKYNLFFNNILGIDPYYTKFGNNFNIEKCNLLYKYTNSSNRNYHIWHNAIEVKNDKKLMSITMPENELLYICNISLA